MIDLHFRKAEVKMLKITKVLSMAMEENELSNDEFRYIDLDNSQEYCQMILFTGSIVCGQSKLFHEKWYSETLVPHKQCWLHNTPTRTTWIIFLMEYHLHVALSVCAL